MARLNIVLPDDLETRFRNAVHEKNGGLRKGDLGEAIAEAIELWLKEWRKSKSR